MSLNSLFADLVQRLRSAEFLLHAVHPDHPTAFTRQRKLPLPALVALLLSGMRKSVQCELDEFFAHLCQRAPLVRKVSEQAFAQARAKLSLTAIPLLNDWVIERAEYYGFVARWNGLRLVAADPLLHGRVSGHLLHPALTGVLGDARNDHPTGVDVYEEQDVVGDQALEVQDLCAEEVSGGQHCAVALNEFCPCRLVLTPKSN